MSFRVAVIGDGVEVRESAIPEAGNGLWATKRFERNELVTEYQGKLIDHEKALKLRNRGLHTHVRVLNSMHLYIDGLKQPEAGRGGASFANDARDPDITNSMFIQKFDSRLGRDRVFLKALREINQGEEFFVSYGKTYWQNSKCKSQPHEQSRQPLQQREQLHRVSNCKCSKPKKQQQSWLGARAQHCLFDEQGSQQSSNTVEEQLAADDGVLGTAGRAGRQSSNLYPRYEQVQLAARNAELQLKVLGQQRKQQQLARAQQQQGHSSRQAAAADASEHRRSMRVCIRQNQQVAAAHSDTDVATGAIEQGWAVQQPRSPVPKRRSRYTTRSSSSSPIAAAAKAVVHTLHRFVQRISSSGG